MSQQDPQAALINHLEALLKIAREHPVTGMPPHFERTGETWKQPSASGAYMETVLTGVETYSLTFAVDRSVTLTRESEVPLDGECA